MLDTIVRLVALLADAVQQNLGGQMDNATAAANLRSLNAQAQRIMVELSK